jgi:glycosyltransferase involved in cell wall biosynthesis
MRISFFYNQNPDLKWRSWTVLNAGLGGVYGTIFNLAKELVKLGHEVTVWGNIRKPDIYDGVNYIDWRMYNPQYREDVLIGCESFPETTSAKKIVNWVYRNTERSLNKLNVDVAVFRSEFHKNSLNYTPKRSVVISDGVDLEIFKPSEKWNNDVTCTCHPIKTFKHFLELTPRIREEIKDIQVHLWGNGEIWGWDQEQFGELQNNLIKVKSLYHGRAGHKTIGEQMGHSKVFLYPSSFEEPFGLAVLEGMACGCVPVVSQVGNLPKLVDGCGYVIEGKPDDFGWYTKATEKVIEVLRNETLFKRLSTMCITRAKYYSWNYIVKKWVEEVL